MAESEAEVDLASKQDGQVRPEREKLLIINTLHPSSFALRLYAKSSHACVHSNAQQHDAYLVACQARGEASRHSAGS